jgi:hypothetical protein
MWVIVLDQFPIYEKTEVTKVEDVSLSLLGLGDF